MIDSGKFTRKLVRLKRELEDLKNSQKYKFSGRVYLSSLVISQTMRKVVIKVTVESNDEKYMTYAVAENSGCVPVAKSGNTQRFIFTWVPRKIFVFSTKPIASVVIESHE